MNIRILENIKGVIMKVSNKYFAISLVLTVVITLLLQIIAHISYVASDGSYCEHGVIVCGQDHVCGNNTDSVCPIYFGASCNFNSLEDNCLDQDCKATIDGVVTDINGNPIEGALVSAVTLSHRSDGIVLTAETNSSGDYSLNIFMDEFFDPVSLSAQAIGYDGSYQFLDLFVIGKKYTANFTLVNGSCNTDCTNWQGICSPSCQGYSEGNDSCNFCDDTAMLACAGKPKGSYALYNLTQDQLFLVKCCEGCPIATPIPPLVLQTDFKTVAKAWIIAMYHDLPVKLTLISGSN